MDRTCILSAMVNKTEIKAYSGPCKSQGRDMRDLRAISGPGLEVNLRVISGSYLRYLGPISRPYLRNLMKLASGPYPRPYEAILRLNMTKYGYLGPVWVPGIAPLPAHPHPYPGYTPPHRTAATGTPSQPVPRSRRCCGAHIRRPTHLRPVILRVWRYDRGLTCS